MIASRTYARTNNAIFAFNKIVWNYRAQSLNPNKAVYPCGFGMFAHIERDGNTVKIYCASPKIVKQLTKDAGFKVFRN